MKKGTTLGRNNASVFLALISLAVIPENGIFRDPETKSILHSPFFKAIIIAILLMFFIPGPVYGIIIGTIRSDKDEAKHLGQAMSGMGYYGTGIYSHANADRSAIPSGHYPSCVSYRRFGNQYYYPNDELFRTDSDFCPKIRPSVWNRNHNQLLASLHRYVNHRGVLLVIWMLVGIPLGTDGPIFLQQ